MFKIARAFALGIHEAGDSFTTSVGDGSEYPDAAENAYEYGRRLARWIVRRFNGGVLPEHWD